jgi:predicted acyltransferase
MIETPAGGYPPIAAQRLESLDVLRGLIVAAMLVVNFSLAIAEYLHVQVAATLLHSAWAGFTLADAIFPAFLFIVGLSIAAAGRGATDSVDWGAMDAADRGAMDGADRRRVALRSLRLLALGFLLSNVIWLWGHDWSFEGGLRIMGVLQRIGLCYWATSLLYRSISLRSMLSLALLVLALYWPLTLIPTPDGGPTDLTVRGLNFVSWFDRVVLGPYRYVAGPTGYDSEGLLSTLPSIAQCLLGAVAGRWLVTRAPRKKSVAAFGLAGLSIAGMGLGWGVYFPIVKDLWTSSFVLLSAGTSMAILALIRLAMDYRWFPRRLARFLDVFGRNAILAYVLCLPGLSVLAVPLTASTYRDLASWLSPAAAALIEGIGFMLLIWAPLAILHRRGRYVRI